ncbi:hypothetical protein [Nocardioides xinjiangensis]|uniref:hypothetical protein n=1 Tax=Nocardioides xinjiangensis TaxID=2817376 RepID=UPI001B313E36|nr:hypothetical protein [Nocardioides sp. SYSU D00514]
MDPRRLLPVLGAAACALVVAALVVTLVRPALPERAAAPPERTEGRGHDTQPGTSTARRGPAAVLAAWDARRSEAWAAGDEAALRRLYVSGSSAGAADVRLLRRYRERGLRVEGLAAQVLALRVAARTPGRLVLVVTDRIVGGTAVGGAVPVVLPTDRASTRRVVLRREAAGEWVVVEARDQDSAAASTSRTSSSSKS